MDISLLQQFYAQASESELAVDKSDSYEVREYDEAMMELRKMIRFFLEWEQKNNYLEME